MKLNRAVLRTLIVTVQLTRYDCVACQQRHCQGEPLYQEHLWQQSKHGVEEFTVRCCFMGDEALLYAVPNDFVFDCHGRIRPEIFTE